MSEEHIIPPIKTDMADKTGYIDSHCHILPGIDDGARDVETSLAIAKKLIELGFDTIVATPHYYSHNESLEQFLERRNKSYSKVDFPESLTVITAAEVALEEGVSKKCDLQKLAIPGTDRILVELPMKKYSPRLPEELFDIKVRHGLVPVIAHFERYEHLFSDENYSDILSVDVLVFQISLFSLAKMRHRVFFKSLYNTGVDIVVGTDAHKIDFRLSDSEKGIRKLKKLTGDECERILQCEALDLDLH